jgi:myo-inositol-1(or 4)-monophosphatase
LPYSQTAQHFLERSLESCKEVYELLHTPLSEEDYTGFNIGAGGDLSLGIDIKAEKIFFRHFEGFAAIDSEEFGLHGEGEYKVVLDPIDGSDNFVSHFPYFGSSMALQYHDETVAALVCNMANGEVFYKVGTSAPIKASLRHDKREEVQNNLHTKVGIFEKSALFPKIIDKLIQSKLKFRSPGAVALSLVYAFDAKYMIFLGPRRRFDLEAGLFITQDLYRYESDNIIIIAYEASMLEEIKAIVLGELQ